MIERPIGVMRIALAFIVLGTACSSADSHARAAAQSALVGTWRALEYTNPDASDSADRFPLGRPLRGYLVYDATGHVFFQTVRGLTAKPEARGRWSDADSTSLHALLSSAVAYFGTYKADYGAGNVIHRIEGEIPPNLGTTEIATPFHVRGDTLVLGRDSSTHWIFVRVRG